MANARLINRMASMGPRPCVPTDTTLTHRLIMLVHGAGDKPWFEETARLLCDATKDADSCGEWNAEAVCVSYNTTTKESVQVNTCYNNTNKATFMHVSDIGGTTLPTYGDIERVAINIISVLAKEIIGFRSVEAVVVCIDPTREFLGAIESCFSELSGYADRSYPEEHRLTTKTVVVYGDAVCSRDEQEKRHALTRSVVDSYVSVILNDEPPPK